MLYKISRLTQLTLDGSTVSNSRKYNRNYKFCKKSECYETIPKENIGLYCATHALENMLDHHFGLDAFIIPNVEAYYKAKRRKDFKEIKAEMLKIYPDGKLV